MSTCPLAEICGGCRYRDMEENAYRELKKRHFATALKALGDISFRLNPPVFIPDGTRRRAVFNFAYRQQKLLLGFNEAASHRIADIEACSLLTPALNGILPLVRRLLEALCREPFTLKKGKKKSPNSDNLSDVHPVPGTVQIRPRLNFGPFKKSKLVAGS